MFPHLNHIVSPEDPRISFFHSLKGNSPRIAAREAVLFEGDQQVARLLAHHWKIQTLFMEPRFYDQFSSLLTPERLCAAECFVATTEVMEQIVGYRLHQGVFALANRPQLASWQELVPPIVALNGVVDPENVGNIVRSCAGFGVKSLLIDRTSCDPYIRRAVRVSMAGILELQVAAVDSLVSVIPLLSPRLKIVSIELCERSTPIENHAFQENSVLVFGNERDGISSDILALSDEILGIALVESNISSLNVNTAAAIALHRCFVDSTKS